MSILIQPFFFTAFALLYFDIRVRKEGFTLSRLSQEMGVTPPDHEPAGQTEAIETEYTETTETETDEENPNETDTTRDTRDG